MGLHEASSPITGLFKNPFNATCDILIAAKENPKMRPSRKAAVTVTVTVAAVIETPDQQAASMVVKVSEDKERCLPDHLGIPRKRSKC